MDPQLLINDCRRIYFSADRCWRSYNTQEGLELCNKLTKKLSTYQPPQAEIEIDDKGDLLRNQLSQLHQLVWFLKIKLLAEDYYVNEAALFNDDDLDEDREYDVRIINGSKLTSQKNSSNNVSVLPTKSSSTIRTDGPMGPGVTQTGKMSAIGTHRTRPMTGMLTGRGQTSGFGMTSRQQSGRASTSYRPLTTGLTATQTAFSKSTRPILKYSAQSLMAKLSFDYLYNAQTVTNKCPDYRQCLEYLNLVQSSVRKNKQGVTNDRTSVKVSTSFNQRQQLIDTREDERARIRDVCSPYWLLHYGICYYNIKMNKQAEEYFERLIQSVPRYLDGYLWLIKIYLRTNEPLKVSRVCSLGLKHNKNALLYNWLARAQSIRDDLMGAHHTLLESFKYFPTNIEGLANAAYFAFYGDQQEQALKCFRRIEHLPQLQVHQNKSDQSNMLIEASSSQLMNNIALCNFYCGNYHLVMPQFNQALLKSPNKDVTSDIWYNISFIPLHCGFVHLAASCLLLALQNNSQNLEAFNNLGVLEYNAIFEDSIDFPSCVELKFNAELPKKTETFCENLNDLQTWTNKCDQAEVYFNPVNDTDEFVRPPESLFNMALIKLRRGHLLASAQYCDLFSQCVPHNYQIGEVIREIKELVTHDF